MTSADLSDREIQIALLIVPVTDNGDMSAHDDAA